MASSDMHASSSSTPTAQSQRSEGLIDRVKDRAAAQLSNQKDKATDGLGSVVQMVREGTQQLRDQKHDTLADYVGRAADQIDRLSGQLRDKDIGELVEAAQDAARRRPAVFIGSAFALGMIGARFFKSSSGDRDDYSPSTRRSMSYPRSSGNVYGTADTTYARTAGSTAGTSVTTPAASSTGSSSPAGTAGRSSDETSSSTAGTSTKGSRRGAGGTTGRP